MVKFVEFLNVWRLPVHPSCFMAVEAGAIEGLPFAKCLDLLCKTVPVTLRTNWPLQGLCLHETTQTQT